MFSVLAILLFPLTGLAWWRLFSLRATLSSERFVASIIGIALLTITVGIFFKSFVLHRYFERCGDMMFGAIASAILLGFAKGSGRALGIASSFLSLILWYVIAGSSW